LSIFAAVIRSSMSKAARTKQYIIEQAAPIFNEKGIAGTSVDDVLQAAQVARGCLYNHFESKQELAHQTMDFLLDSILARLQAVLNQETSAKAKIHAYLEFNKDPLHTPIAGGCPIFNAATEADNTDLVVKEKVRAAMVAGHKLLAGILQQGVEKREFASTLEPQEFAFKLIAAVEGALIMCRILHTAKPMHQLIKNLKAELKTFELQ
jgi:AcrR family transcriptional regulator